MHSLAGRAFDGLEMIYRQRRVCAPALHFLAAGRTCEEVYTHAPQCSIGQLPQLTKVKRGLRREEPGAARPGAPTKSRVAIYVFDSLAKANAWHDAPEQKELVALRDKSSNFRSYIVEGCATCSPPSK